MIQNLLWATGYNVVALPLAAGALYAWGVLLTPALGVVLMSASTVIVAINARLLRLKQPLSTGREQHIPRNTKQGEPVARAAPLGMLPLSGRRGESNQ